MSLKVFIKPLLCNHIVEEAETPVRTAGFTTKSCLFSYARIDFETELKVENKSGEDLSDCCHRSFDGDLVSLPSQIDFILWLFQQLLFFKLQATVWFDMSKSKFDLFWSLLNERKDYAVLRYQFRHLNQLSLWYIYRLSYQYVVCSSALAVSRHRHIKPQQKTKCGCS